MARSHRNREHGADPVAFGSTLKRGRAQLVVSVQVRQRGRVSGAGGFQAWAFPGGELQGVEQAGVVGAGAEGAAASPSLTSDSAAESTPSSGRHARQSWFAAGAPRCTLPSTRAMAVLMVA